MDAELVVPDGDPAVRSPHWPASGMSYSKAGSSTTGRFHEDVAGRRLPIPRAVLSRLSRAASAPASVQELDGTLYGVLPAPDELVDLVLAIEGEQLAGFP